MSTYYLVAITGTYDSQPLADQCQVTLHKVRVHLASARFGASQETEFSRLQLFFANQTLFSVRQPIFWGQRAGLKLFTGLLFFSAENSPFLPHLFLPIYLWFYTLYSQLAPSPPLTLARLIRTADAVSLFPWTDPRQISLYSTGCWMLRVRASLMLMIYRVWDVNPSCVAAWGCVYAINLIQHTRSMGKASDAQLDTPAFVP